MKKKWFAFSIILLSCLSFLEQSTNAQSEPLKEGWVPIFQESFDTQITDNWNLISNDPIFNWKTTDKLFDRSNPNSTHSAKAIPEPPPDKPEKGYPPKITNMIISKNPVDLSNKTGTELLFSFLPEFSESARLGACVGTSSAPQQLTHCMWYDMPSSMWQFSQMDLRNFSGNPNPIYLAFIFETGQGSPEKPGVFVDEVQIWATDFPPIEQEDFGWQSVYKESFGHVDMSNDPNWTLITNKQDVQWCVTDLEFDKIDLDEPRSAAAISSLQGGYPAGLENWMIYGPLDLQKQKTIEVYFSYYLDGTDVDRLGFVVGKGNTIADFIPENIMWLSANTSWRNIYKEIGLPADGENVYLAWFFKSEYGDQNKNGAFIDRIEVNASEKVVPPLYDHSSDFVQWKPIFSESFETENLFTDDAWTAIKEKGDSIFQTNSVVFDPINPESSHSIGITSSGLGYSKNVKTWMIYGPLDLSQVSHADAKFSIFVDLENNPDYSLEKNDHVGFFATPANAPSEMPQKLANAPKIKMWSGHSQNNWIVFHADLTSITGQSNIYLAWFFESFQGSDSKKGAFIDELEINGQSKESNVPKISFNDNGLRIENGDFGKNSLYNWNLKDHGPADGQVNMHEIKGNYFPSISGNQIFYQQVKVSSEINDLFVSFSYAVRSTETQRGNDIFCVTLTDADDTDTILIDLGCWDMVDFPNYAKNEDEGLTWVSYEKSLDDDQIEIITSLGKESIGFVIEVTQDQSDTGCSTLYLDDINIYATGFTRRTTGDTTLTFASQRDPGEPNDNFNRATTLTCGETFSGEFGDVGGGFDIDFFKISQVPKGGLEIDINAKTLQPQSAADSRLELYDAEHQLLTKNDDDGNSLDPYIYYDSTIDNATYYIAVKNAHGGGPYFYYELNVNCGQTIDVVASAQKSTKKQSRQTPKNSTTVTGDLNNDGNVNLSDVITGLQISTNESVSANLAADVDGDSQIGTRDTLFALEVSAGLRETVTIDEGDGTWTMILFLNAEDQSCVNLGEESTCWNKIYEASLNKIGSYISEKSDFLTIVALVDGPNFNDVESDVTRYVVQSNGNYTENQNIWYLDEINMGAPDDFSDYVEWAMTNYPADHYYVAVHNHGHGIFGMSWDHNDKDGETIDDYLTPPELRSALKEITNNGENKIDIFEFQACLMGLLENAYDIKDYVDYICFFQPISWSSYNYPEYFKNIKKGDDPLTVGTGIIQNYPVSGDTFPYAFSLIDATKLTSLREKLDEFTTVLMASDRSLILNARNRSQAFNGNVNKGDPKQDVIGYIDLWDLAQKISETGIAETEAKSLQSAIDEAVKTSKATLKGGDPLWDYSNFHGISILYPMGNFSFLSDYALNYKMCEEGNWDDFLTHKAFDYKKRSSTDNDRIYHIPEILEESLWGGDGKALNVIPHYQ
jgi:hypothetical protein